MVDCGEPLSIVGLQCDCKCANGMHHIAQHGNWGEKDLVLELAIKLLNNIQMKRMLTFAKYVEGTNEIENQQTH